MELVCEADEAFDVAGGELVPGYAGSCEALCRILHAVARYLRRGQFSLDERRRRLWSGGN